MSLVAIRVQVAFARLLAVVLGLVLISQATAAQAQVEAVAIAGKPFGVLRITTPNSFGGESFDLFSPDGRVLYPAAAANGQPVRRLIRNLLKIEGPPSLTMYCLFKGNAPLSVRLYSPDGPALAVNVVNDSAGHIALLNSWWTAFRAPIWQGVRLTVLSCSAAPRMRGSPRVAAHMRSTSRPRG